MPKAAHLRAIPVAQMYKTILGQKASSGLIILNNEIATSGYRPPRNDGNSIVADDQIRLAS